MLNAARTWFDDRVSLRSFGQGAAVVVLFYAVIFVILAMKSESTMQSLEHSLSSKIVSIQREVIAEHVEEPEVFGPMPYVPEEIPPAHHVDVDPVPAVPPQAAATNSIAFLAPAPIDDVSEKTDQGILPKISASGQKPFDVYKRPFATPNKPVIAIVLTDYGLSESDSKAALVQLPPEVTLLLSPYAAKPEQFQKDARADGHEIWVQIPFQTENFPQDDPGPKAIMSLAKLADNQNNLRWVLSRTSGYTGIAASLDGKFMEAQPMLQALLKFCFTRGLGYLELSPAGLTLGQTVAAENVVPYGKAALRPDMLDEDVKALTEERARSDGSAILVFKASPKSIDDLKDWIVSLGTKGIMLAPVSAVVKAPGR